MTRQKKQKPVKVSHTRLGLKLDKGALGWAIFKERGYLPTERQHGDPLELALLEVPFGTSVELICYSDDESFKHSQAYQDGLTRKEHFDFMIGMLVSLNSNNRPASIKWITVEDESI